MTAAMARPAGVRSSGSTGSWPPLAAEFRYVPYTLRSHLKTSNYFLEFCDMLSVANGTFLTSHAWALLCIARDPEMRLRDIGQPGRRMGCGQASCGLRDTTTRTTAVVIGLRARRRTG